MSAAAFAMAVISMISGCTDDEPEPRPSPVTFPPDFTGPDEQLPPTTL